MGLSLPHLIVILLIVLLVFGAGKLPKIMSDLAKGLKAFKNELNDKDEDKKKD
jgi:sec-independent protein translocase protein TatA